MCGIVGYIGPKSIESVLLVGLQKLEYRGYDSTGMAVLNGDELVTRKAVGKIAELEKLCGDAFKALQIPKHWKFENYDRCRLTEDETSEIQTIGAWFLDTNTKGIDIKRYRLYFHSYSERLGLVEKSVVEYGKYKQELLVQNKTPEQLNELLKTL